MVQVEVIETPGLGDRSYLVHDSTSAVVIDPQRDVDRVGDLLADHGLRLEHVLETHVHNDYVTGGPQLAHETGASYLLPAASGASVAHEPLADGDVVSAGSLRLTALRTPGHTHHHTSYAASGTGGVVEAVFTGGSMLFGAAGRTDLVGAEHTRALAADQHRSVRRLAALAPAAVVHPTHGFGSFCAATPTTGTSSTIGEQARVNPAMLLEESEYVESLLRGLIDVPSYYAHMAPTNRVGAAPIDLSMPPQVSGTQLAERLARGEWVVDLRERRAFAAGHLRGSRSFELSGAFVTHLGWLLPWGAALTLIGDDAAQVLDARRQLARIGVDHLTGAATGPVAALAGERVATGAYPVADFADLAVARQRGPVQVLDVRRTDEHAAAAVVGAQNIPLHELEDRMAQVDGSGDHQVWVHCASGYRAGTAASLLARSGRRVVLIDDAFDAARGLGLLAEHSGE